MSLKLFGVPASQPTRAIMFLCKIKNYPYELIKMSPASKTDRDEYIKSINPSGKIPGIELNGFTLFESGAIMSYLCNINNWNDLYPNNDINRVALINEYMYWHQENTRKIAAGYYRPLMQSWKTINDWNPISLRNGL